MRAGAREGWTIDNADFSGKLGASLPQDDAMKKSLESLTHTEFERLANEAMAEAVAQAMARGVPVTGAVDGKVMHSCLTIRAWLPIPPGLPKSRPA